MDTSLKGRHVIITGGSGFLGSFHAKTLLANGSIPVLIDIDKDKLEHLASMLEDLYSVRILTYVADVACESSLKDIKADLDDMRIYPYGLVNNAAIDAKISVDPSVAARLSRFETFSLERWLHEFNVCVTGALLCCQIFGTPMAERREGVIVNVSSDLSVISPDQRLYRKKGVLPSEQPVKPISYVVSKTAVHAITRYLATYWAEYGIRVNTLSPGGVFFDQPEEFVRDIQARIPLGRMAMPEEISNSLIYLLSDLSSYLTGFNLVLDGGRSCW